MSLRIAWACYPRNVGLGIAANVFVYVGTIILFMIDWFFVQRIIRAQHQHIGWSTPYRIFHRAALVVLIITLIMLILVNIWQFFTISDTKLHVFRALQLTGQTYFTVFCFAPAILLLVSFLVPRREIEKFGAGRLRVNITILLIAVTVLTAGQLFRCVIAWIPQTPFFDAVGQPVGQPWYLHKACFYVFNFVTEIVVVIMFAVVRVDLRFHVPNGSRMSGDYSGRNSRINLSSSITLDGNINHSATTSKKSLPCISPIVPMSHHRNDSSDTLHKYERSIFEDSNTLADSLRYASSTLEVDSKTGNWKVKRVSTGSTQSSIYSAPSPTRSSFNDRTVTFADDAPPVPVLPTEWSLANNQSSHNSMNSSSKRNIPKKPFEIADHDLNGVDVGDAITDALAALEHNSDRKEEQSPIGPVSQAAIATNSPIANENKTRMNHTPLAPRKRSTFPPKSALKTSRIHSSTNSTASCTPTIIEAPELPQPPLPTAAPPVQRYSTAEFITLFPRPSSDARRILDMSLQGDRASDISAPESAKDASHQGSIYASALSSMYSQGTTSSDARETATAEEEFRRFSYEASPVAPGSEGDIMRDRRFD
jgi:hypothetical protein